MKRATISDVAKLAGVSKSTVSQYLNKRFQYMSDKTQEKIEKAIDELNYQPNELARGLKQKKTSMIGVIVAAIDSDFSTQIISAIEKQCREKGIQVIMCNYDEDPEKEKQCIDMLVARHIDGLIVFPNAENKQLYIDLLKQDYPLVFLDRKIAGITTPTILFDNMEASRMAVEYFVKKGHEKIGILTKPIGKYFISTRFERVEGYKKGLMENEIPIKNEYIYNCPMEEIPNALRELFQLKDPPTAILAGNDLILEEVLMFAKENNYMIPDKFGVVGIDDVSFTKFYSPTITAISQPSFEMGKKAAQVLIAKIEGDDDMAVTYRFPPTFHERESVNDLRSKE